MEATLMREHTGAGPRLEVAPKTAFEAGLAAFASPQGDFQQAAWRRFQELGLPTHRLEAWKALDLPSIFNRAYGPANGNGPLPDITAHRLSGAFCVVWVNGVWVPSLSDVAGLPLGVRLTPLTPENFPHETPLQTEIIAETDDAFVALNAALFTSGVCLTLDPGVVLERPLQVLFITTDSEDNAPQASFPRLHVAAAVQSRCAIIAQALALQSETPSLQAPVVTLDVGASAEVDYTALFSSESDVATVLAASQVRLQAHSRLQMTTVALGHGVMRHHVETAFLGEGVEATVNGLSVLEDHSQVYHHTVLDHRQPHTTSRQLYKAILSGHARQAFNGTIQVRPGAQKTDATQLSRSLLLSADARVETRPQLRIEADDVKCSHGATVGQLDDEALFYLQSRGVSAGDARRLLNYGFAGDVVETLSHPDLRAWVACRVLNRLSEGEALPIKSLEVKG